MYAFRVPPGRHRYLLRNADPHDALAIIEASSVTQAIERGAIVGKSLTLPTMPLNFSAEKITEPLALPTFLEEFFYLVQSQYALNQYS